MPFIITTCYNIEFLVNYQINLQLQRVKNTLINNIITSKYVEDKICFIIRQLSQNGD